ncbi:MAG: pilin [bacterium]
MKKNTYLKIFISIAIAVWFIFPLIASATSTEFKLNVPLGSKTTVSSFDEYISLWYQFFAGVVGVLVTVMLMWGGMKWLTSRGNSGTINEAKDIIISAIAGLILFFLSYTVLSLVNPRLTIISMPELGPGVDSAASPGSGGSSLNNNISNNSNKDTQPSTTGTGTGQPSPNNTPTNETANRSALNNAGVNITSSGNCQDCNNGSCTCVGGLASTAVNSAIRLKQQCTNCVVDVTGGTETGHHYGCNDNCYDIQRKPGEAGYDKLDQNIQTNGTRVYDGGSRNYPCGSMPCYRIGDTIYYQENTRHWHAQANYY